MIKIYPCFVGFTFLFFVLAGCSSPKGIQPVFEHGELEIPETHVSDCRFISGYDGDSFTVMLDLHFSVYSQQTIRLEGIDTPEIRGGSENTKKAGKLVKEYVFNWVRGEALIARYKRNNKEKYGSYLVEILKAGVSLNKHLVERGFAKEYYGGTKEKWTNKEALIIIKALQ